MTGWDMPPGCNVRNIPGNSDETCDCCGTDNLDKCICPECPVCEQHGDPACYRNHGMIYNALQLQGQRRVK